jgi:hypothetical protein
MTIRRQVSLRFQKEIMDHVDRHPDLLEEPEVGIEGEQGPDIPDEVPYWFEYRVYQERPYSFTFIEAWNDDEKTFWAQGYSKCIGVHKGHGPDEWNAREGIRLAVARAASKIGEKIEKFETGSVE